MRIKVKDWVWVWGTGVVFFGSLVIVDGMARGWM